MCSELTLFLFQKPDLCILISYAIIKPDTGPNHIRFILKYHPCFKIQTIPVIFKIIIHYYPVCRELLVT